MRRLDSGHSSAAKTRRRRTLRAVRAIALGVVLTCAGGTPRSGESDAPPVEQIDRALARVYVHGVTEALALREVGRAGVARILEHLRDPAHPRRDNLMAFLCHLGGPTERQAVLDAFTDPRFSVAIPEEDRARLLAPQVLGWLARRGDDVSLRILLEMTAGTGMHPSIRAAADAYDRPAWAEIDLVERALYGLAVSGREEAGRRLADVAGGEIALATTGRSLARSASTFVDVMAAFDLLDTTAEPDPGGSSGPLEPAFDTGLDHHEHRLTYANHPDVPSPMDDARLDVILADASLKAGSRDYLGDVSCCASVVREATASSFGSPGDGLDVIDDAAESNAVFGSGAGRFKVLRQINWCGGPGVNFAGCAPIPGATAQVVRASDVGIEGVLWIHEYGHNLGLQHATQNGLRIMFPTVNTGGGLTQFECNRFHTPDPAAEALFDAIAECRDSDGDEINNEVDADDDNDGVPDGLDCAPQNANFTEQPGEGGDLVWSDSTHVSWTPGTQSDSFNVYRGDVAFGAPSGLVCLDGEARFPNYDELDDPTPAAGFVYLVTMQNPCGESAAGADSESTPRTPTGCP